MGDSEDVEVIIVRVSEDSGNSEITEDFLIKFLMILRIIKSDVGLKATGWISQQCIYSYIMI